MKILLYTRIRQSLKSFLSSLPRPFPAQPQSKSNTIPLGPVATSDPSSSHVLQVEPNEDPFKTEPDEPQGLSGQEVGGATIASPLDQEVGVESPIDPAMGGLVLQGKK